MPMLKRPVEPSAITRSADGQIPKHISNELEYVANSTQANLIRSEMFCVYTVIYTIYYLFYVEFSLHLVFGVTNSDSIP